MAKVSPDFHVRYDNAYDKYQKKIKQLTKRDLLIIDDFLLHSITDEREVKVLFEIMEKCSELNNSTIICSQREPKSWTAMIYNDEVASNALLNSPVTYKLPYTSM